MKCTKSTFKTLKNQVPELFREIMKIKTLLLILLSCSQLSSSTFDDPCGDWIPYKDEKCLKIIDQNLVDYTDAENICKNEDGALLPSITTEEKQQFMENLLKSQNVVDNVWIGLKYVNESYVWADGTKVDYTHWSGGSPTNDSNYCVQLEADMSLFGYWADTACSKKNIVMCEKLQLWSLSKIQSTLIDVVRNPVPIGFIYVQLPKESPPQEIWSWMEWKDVSSDYAGLFFRTEGGNSASFGEIQNESSPRLAAVQSKWTNVPEIIFPEAISIPPDGEESDYLYASVTYGSDFRGRRGIKFQLSKEDVCPRNTAIRIWKRVL